MGVLRSIEHRIESLVEGAFGRAFRSHVQPVELARKLAKEMDEHRTISISRVYVPNEYVVYVSPQDRQELPPEAALLTELGDYLSEHARREGYALVSTPRVLLEEDEDLQVGEFGIATRMVQAKRPGQPPTPAPDAAPAPPDVEQAPALGETKIFRPAETAAVSAQDAEKLGLAHEPAVLVVDGRRHALEGTKPLVIGRSREADIRVEDPNVSRRHAEVRRDGNEFVVVDLGSTNGIEVNGRRVERGRLANGDTVVVGRTELTFEDPS